MKLFKTKGADHKLAEKVRSGKQTTQNNLNRALLQPYSPGIPYVMGNDKKDFISDGYEGNANVYSVINVITRAAAAVPWQVFVVKDSKAKYKYKGWGGNKRVESPVQSHNLKKKALELAEQSDLAGVIERPNPHQGQSEFFENFLGFKLATGDTYMHGIEVNKAFGELWIMPAHLVEIISSGKLEDVVRGYRITEHMYDVELEAETVLHSKYWNPDYSSKGSHLYGMSPLQAATGVVTQSNDTYTANQRALQNMGAEGMLSLDDDATITDEQRDDLKKQLKRRGQGPENYKKILVNTAKWRWLHFGISPVDLNIIESMKMSLRDLCNVYGISSELLNDPDNKTNSNKKESRKALYYETVIPEIDAIRDELNRWLAPDHSRRDGIEYFIDYDISAIPALAEDMAKKTEWLQQAWPITGNEFREAIGYEALDMPIMDVPMVDIGKRPVDQEMNLQREIRSFSKSGNGVHAN